MEYDWPGSIGITGVEFSAAKAMRSYVSPHTDLGLPLWSSGRRHLRVVG
jgi:hypothetical protein